MEEIRAAGLANQRGNDYFPFRLMFPLADARGRVIGFQARRLRDDDPLKGKYVNTPESELLLGIVRALKAGPRDAVEMMARGSAPIPVTSLVTLDTLAQSQGPWAAAAAFDAAYILELWPPQGDPTFWQSLARRYGHAETVLTNASDKARAKELASAARATAKTLLPASQR